MKQREQQTETAEALQFLDETDTEQSAVDDVAEVAETGELMASEEHTGREEHHHDEAYNEEAYSDEAYDDQSAYDDDAYHGDDSFDDDDHYGDYGEDHPHAYDANHDAAPPRSHPSALNTVAWLSGLASLLAGLALTAAWSWDSVAAIADLRQLLEGMGLAPVDLVMLGIVLAGLAGLRRHLHHHDTGVAQALQGSRSNTGVPEDLQSQIAYLVEAASKQNGESGGQSPQELQRALHLLKRQEEKINNLSKATRMYGKPLIEITNQMAEATHQLAEISSRVDAVKIISEQSAGRLETVLRDELGKVGGADNSGLRESIQATRDAVKALEALQSDMSQRLTDKSDKIAGNLQTVLRDTTKNLESLHSDLEQARAAIVEKVEGIEVPAAAAASVETPAELTDAIAKIGKQLSGLTKKVGQLGAVSASAGAAPRPVDEGGGQDDEPAGAPGAGSEKGKSSSSNVMSAIAKLKQLRT